jgi:NosR/NirI family transcriptional regulator, nitrous oxide reductase regulator
VTSEARSGAHRSTRWRRRLVVSLLALVLAGLFEVGCAWALGDKPRAGETVTQYLTPAILQELFPGAERIGEVSGTPPAATVYKGDRPIGYIFSTWDVTQSRGFADRPLVLLVGLDLSGRITGVKMVHHAEAIGILGLRDEDFLHFPDQFTGYNISNHLQVSREPISPPAAQESSSQQAKQGQAPVRVDAIAHATTSSIFMSDAIVRGARIVARSRGLLPSANKRLSRIDVDRFEPADWSALEAAGAVAHLHITYQDVLEKLRERGATRIVGGDGTAAAEAPFLDLYVALLTPAGIGINILGTQWYDKYMYAAGRGTDDQMLLIAAAGHFPVLGTDSGYADTVIPLELVQGEKTMRLSAKQITTLPFLHSDGTPQLAERGLVFPSGQDELDPGRPWQIRLLIPGETAEGRPVFADFALPYRLPDKYLLTPAAGSTASENEADETSSLAWLAIWRARYGEIAVLGVALTALTAILFLQATISRRPRLHRWIRIGFLSWTLVWLGWYAGAQLTVVLVITWIHALVTDFRWDSLFADPLIAILLGFTIVSMFFWGRAAFCGWLCPFGALQELTNTLARRLRVPQLTIPIALHSRLVVAKYVLFVALVCVSFFSWDLAMAGTEIEPFKAAIILRFMTQWPMVAYALALVAASLFVERFYCRFACPLGGGLAILGKVRIFNSLKRHAECGSRCHVCEAVCPVGAIKRNGQINMNECFFCLDCQVTYYDDHICPPMVWRRKLLERGSESRSTPMRASSR